jgi:large subunit ribosomal protein L22e
LPPRSFVDFSGPASDGILDAAGFEKFLHDRIKVEGKAGQLGEAVSVTREGEGKIWISTTIPFSKRYLKYLTKKYLKRSQLRDWLRVVATSKQGFEIKVGAGASNQKASSPPPPSRIAMLMPAFIRSSSTSLASTPRTTSERFTALSLVASQTMLPSPSGTEQKRRLAALSSAHQ